MIVSCPTLRIGPYIFYIEEFITQFKTTEKKNWSPHSFSKKWRFLSMAKSSRKEKATIFSADAYCNLGNNLKPSNLKLNWSVTIHTYKEVFQWGNRATMWDPFVWFSACTRIAKTNMSSIERSFYLFKTHTICAIFLYYWKQCIDCFILLLKKIC